MLFSNVFKYCKRNIFLKKVTTRKIQKSQIDGFFWWSSDFLTHIIAHKSAKTTQKIATDEARMQLRLKARALRHLCGSLFKKTDLKNWKQK